MGSVLSKSDPAVKLVLLLAALRAYSFVRNVFASLGAKIRAAKSNVGSEKEGLMPSDAEDEIACMQKILEGDSHDFRAKAKAYMLKHWDVFSVDADQEWTKTAEEQRLSALKRQVLR